MLQRKSKWFLSHSIKILNFTIKLSVRIKLTILSKCTVYTVIKVLNVKCEERGKEKTIIVSLDQDKIQQGTYLFMVQQEIILIMEQDDPSSINLEMICLQ